jgi:hypothetical protein
MAASHPIFCTPINSFLILIVAHIVEFSLEDGRHVFVKVEEGDD